AVYHIHINYITTIKSHHILSFPTLRSSDLLRRLARPVPLICSWFFLNLVPYKASGLKRGPSVGMILRRGSSSRGVEANAKGWNQSEEHTSELQSPCNLVCRLVLEKKNKLST